MPTEAPIATEPATKPGQGGRSRAPSLSIPIRRSRFGTRTAIGWIRRSDRCFRGRKSTAPGVTGPLRGEIMTT